MAELVAMGGRVRPVPRQALESLVRHLGGLPKEMMLALPFDDAGRIRGHLANWGAISSVSGTYRSLVEQVFGLRAIGFVLVHNHPSGNPSPSGPDITATRRLSAIARVMNIEFFDHIIVGGRAAVSLRAAGLMTPGGHRAPPPVARQG